MLANETIKQILIVDRDVAAVEPLRHKLTDAGFAVRAIAEGTAAVKAVAERPPHLVIIDWNMPGFAALEVIQGIRKARQPQGVKLIILSALAEEQDVVTGLNLGADDYIAKPFEPRELVARIKAVLRRRSAPSGGSGGDGSVEFAGWRFDRLKRQLLSPQQVVVPLSSAEYRLLSAFVERPRRVLTRDQLLDATRGQGVVVADRAIDLAVSRLRQKLSAAQDGEQLICTIRGEGYIFDAEVK